MRGLQHLRKLRNIFKGLALSAFSLLITLLLLEFFVLRLIDPLGIRRYHADLDLMFQGTEPDELRGWIQKPGTYHLSDSTATVLKEGRFTPETNTSAPCTIAAIGDSITFGHGVDDQDVWVNSLARRYPQAHFINAGVTGYNIENVQAVLETLEADGYIYVIAGNDAEPMLVWSEDWVSPPSYPAMALYIRHILISTHEQSTLKNPAPAPPDYDAFDAHLEEILGYNVQAFVFDDPWTLDLHVSETFPQVKVLISVTSVNSWADPHADAVGHQQIAEQMIPYLSDWITQVCKH